MVCPKCGKEIADDSRFCEFCGTKVSKPKSMKVRWVLLSILLGLSALSVGLLFVYGSHRRHIEEAVGTKATQVEEKIVANDTIRHDESAKGSEENKGKVKRTEAVHEADGVRKESALSSDWVDLGLPSGTLWKRNNENGYFTNDEAKRLYRKKLPSIDQFTELVKHCRAVWSDGGFRFIGDNGQTIFIKADGYKSYTGEIEEFGSLISCYTSDLWWIEGDSPSDYLCMFVYQVQYSSYNWEPSSPMQGYTVHLVRKP